MKIERFSDHTTIYATTNYYIITTVDEKVVEIYIRPTKENIDKTFRQYYFYDGRTVREAFSEAKHKYRLEIL